MLFFPHKAFPLLDLRIGQFAISQGRIMTPFHMADMMFGSDNLAHHGSLGNCNDLKPVPMRQSRE
jgi:hypothetical protein